MPKSRLVALLVAGALLVSLAVWGLLALRGRSAQSRLREALTGRGRVAWAWAGASPPTAVPGATFVPLTPEGALDRALRGRQPAAVVAALEELGAQALVLGSAAPDAGTGGVGDGLASYGRVPGMRGLYLSPDAVVYGPDPWQGLPDKLQLALSTVARGMLRGQPAPRVASFPEPLRRVQHVEVMVMLRAGPRPRLWRSARGSSIAQALLTAARVARTRWTERQQAMGAPLAEALPGLTVEVSLLQDDGRLGSRDPAFIDRVFGAEHGVAYERKGAWRYLLPAATRDAGKGSAARAFEALLAQDGLSAASLQAADLEPYRLAVNVLATSAPE